ncbi:MAG: hypothetical protein M1816_006079 [Peltula sp. TS41687]|nr:MAG: hypothetical protein M1816_006079 [Peltula sp. TS41687]
MAEGKRSSPVFFFDIDNCQKPPRLTTTFEPGKRVFDMMQDLIDQYLVEHLSLSQSDAVLLHRTYYKQYGLAIEGLVRHHKIDPLDYNRRVDDALPLETVLSPDAQLRRLLGDLDRSKIRPWLFTNAYITHAKRVVRLLGVDDLFVGLTYCDYAAPQIVCKPFDQMYRKAQQEAGVAEAEDCYFVDDSWANCRRAHELGWTAVHLLEPDDPDPPEKAARYQIRSLEELRDLFPRLFRSSNSSGVEMNGFPSDVPCLKSIVRSNR